MTPTLTLRTNKPRLLRTIGIMALFVVLGAWNLSLLGNRPEPGTFTTIVSITTMVFFGISALLLLYKLLANKPEVLITPEGFTVPLLLFADDRISWEEVQGFRWDRLLGDDVLVVELTDPAAYQQRTPGLKRLLRRSSLKHYGSPVLLNSNGVDVEMRELEEALREAWYHYKTSGA